MTSTTTHNRRQHAKSRNGCTKCKSRHVRCDEAGPPCGRCQIRGDACDYVGTPSHPPSKTKGDGNLTSAGQISTAYIAARSHEAAFPEDRHLLELQLMHRWTASTYKSCCTPGSEDDEVWQSWVPQLAIQHDYLLYGLLSLAAFDVARLVEQTPCRQRYIESAMEFHGLAMTSFRVQISVINSSNIDAAVCMSLMLLVLACASAQGRAASLSDDEGEGMVQTVLEHFELLRGCSPIIASKKDYLSENPFIQKLKPLGDLPRTLLDARLDKALVSLAELNDKRITSSVHMTNAMRAQQVDCWEVCKAALSLLRTLYEKCVDDFTRGYALGWLNMAGDRYVTALKDRDTVSLLILMYWGVLVDRCGLQVWWAEQFGSLLVAEIARHPLFREADVHMKGLILDAQQYINQ